MTRGPGAGRCRSSQRTPELEGRARLAQCIEEGQRVTEGVGGREPVDRSPGRWRGWRPGHGRTGPSARAPGHGPLRVAQDLAWDRLALQPLDDEPVGAQIVAHAHGHDGGHRDSHVACAAWSSDRSIWTLPDWLPMSPRSIWRISRRGGAPADSSTNALVTLEAPPESRCRSRTVPPRCAPSAAAISSPASRALTCRYVDGDDGPPAVVELVEVFADAETGPDPAGRILVGPARQPLVDHGAARPADVGHAQDVAAQRVDAARLVVHLEVHDPVRHAVVGQLGPHVPLADRGRPATVPHPTPVQVAGISAEADAPEVQVLAAHRR